MGLARHQASSLESIHRGGDRPAGERDAPPDLIDRLWPLVKKQLHDSEVGQAHIQRLNALRRQALERPVRLHQDEPQMRARDVGGLPLRGGAPHRFDSLTSRYFMSSYKLNLTPETYASGIRRA